MPVTTVSAERGDGWALITLSSPAGLNKLGSETLGPLLEMVRENLSGDCRCLAITGGGGSFAVGADLREIAALTPPSARAFSDLGNSIFRTLENTDTIVVAGIDGFCLGGGLDLALAADWRIATARSVFGHPGSDLGLITGFGGTQRLPRLIGATKASSWLLTAKRVSAADAHRAGLVQELTPTEDLRETLMKRIAVFARLSPDWIRETKRGFREQGDSWLAPGRGCACLR